MKKRNSGLGRTVRRTCETDSQSGGLNYCGHESKQNGDTTTKSVMRGGKILAETVTHDDSKSFDVEISRIIVKIKRDVTDLVSKNLAEILTAGEGKTYGQVIRQLQNFKYSATPLEMSILEALLSRLEKSAMGQKVSNSLINGDSSTDTKLETRDVLFHQLNFLDKKLRSSKNISETIGISEQMEKLANILLSINDE